MERTARRLDVWRVDGEDRLVEALMRNVVFFVASRHGVY